MAGKINKEEGQDYASQRLGRADSYDAFADDEEYAKKQRRPICFFSVLFTLSSTHEIGVVLPAPLLINDTCSGLFLDKNLSHICSTILRKGRCVYFNKSTCQLTHAHSPHAKTSYGRIRLVNFPL